jgi:parallel beta-helix repeat protein
MWPFSSRNARPRTSDHSRRRPCRPRCHPRLEPLEDRTLPSAYLVTTTADSGPGSLRDAINQVNADTSHALYASPSNPSVDEIDFQIPTTDPGYDPTTGGFTIAPLTLMPELTTSALFDGTTQPGFAGTPIIILNGSQAGFGLIISADNSIVKGLVIQQCPAYGLVIGNRDTVVGNYIGTDITGSVALGNGFGVVISGSDNTIGGATAGARNVISGNNGSGVEIWSSQNLVAGNYIGTNAASTAALGNLGGGVTILDASANTISGNVVSGNSTGDGVSVAGSAGNQIIGNLIGTTASDLSKDTEERRHP